MSHSASVANKRPLGVIMTLEYKCISLSVHNFLKLQGAGQHAPKIHCGALVLVLGRNSSLTSSSRPTTSRNLVLKSILHWTELNNFHRSYTLIIAVHFVVMLIGCVILHHSVGGFGVWSIFNTHCWSIFVTLNCCSSSSFISGQMSTVTGAPVTRREKLLVGIARLLETDDHLASLISDINSTLK